MITQRVKFVNCVIDMIKLFGQVKKPMLTSFKHSYSELAWHIFLLLYELVSSFVHIFIHPPAYFLNYLKKFGLLN